VDDKGCVLIGCWGMPHLSYLDNAQRALSAAAQIKYEMNKLEMNCSFGITTGDVYCGTVGSALRMEYAAIGSVVNMSARLMCKACGGILIDDATYTRLPVSVLDTLKHLDPIKVKGRDEPLQVYAYIAGTSIQVKEKVVEDNEISQECKEKLTILINRLTAIQPTTPKKARQGSLASVKMWISGSIDVPQRTLSRLISSSMIVLPASVQPLPLVVMSGKEGSGRTTVVKWLTKQVQDRNIPVLHVKVGKKDSTIPYAVFRKLFALLTTKAADSQLNVILTLLDEVYLGSAQHTIQTAFIVIKSVLGVSVNVTETSDTSKQHWLSRKMSIKPLVPSVVYDTLFRIFTHVLIMQTRLIVVENVEMADEDSLRLLSELCKISASSGILLTALDSSGAINVTSGKVSPPTQYNVSATTTPTHTSADAATTAIHPTTSNVTNTATTTTTTTNNSNTNPNTNTMGMVIPPPINTTTNYTITHPSNTTPSNTNTNTNTTHNAYTPMSPTNKSDDELTPWGREFKDYFHSQPFTTTITLANYTPEEIDAMLCAALGVSEVPPEISQLVQDFSGMYCVVYFCCCCIVHMLIFGMTQLCLKIVHCGSIASNSAP